MNIKLKIINLTIAMGILSCSPELMHKKNLDSSLLTITDDALFIATVDQLLQNGKQIKINNEAAMRYFDLQLLENDEKYGPAFNLLRERGDTIQTALMLNTLAWEYRFHQELSDRFYNLIEYAVHLADIPGLADDIQGKYPDISMEFDKYWANIHDTYAWYLIQYNETQSALGEYEKILNRYESTSLYLNYAELLRRINRYEEALQVSIRALELSPTDQDAIHMIRETGRTLTYEESAIQALLKKATDQAKEILNADIEKHRVNEKMPFFQLPLLSGGEISSDMFSGTHQVILIWSNTCTPCLELMNRCQSVYESQSASAGVSFYTMTTEKNESVLRAYMSERKFSFPVLLSSDYIRQLGVTVVPSLIITDASGMICYHLSGIQYLKNLPAMMELLTEKWVTLQ